MADTGWVIASGATNNTGIGTAAWTGLGEIAVDGDLNRATVFLAGGEISNYLEVAFASLAVPSGSTVDGIEFKGVSFSGFATYDHAVRAVKSGAVGSTDRSSATHWNGLSELIWGGAADLWGETWTVAQVNAIAVAISCEHLAKGGDGGIDAVYARITYTAGGGGGSIPVFMNHYRQQGICG